MASNTLRQQAKKMQGTTRDAAVVSIFSRQAPLLEVLPFRSIDGGVLSRTRQSSLPSVSTRGVGGTYTKSQADTTPINDAVSIIGGEGDIDVAQERMTGSDNRAEQQVAFLTAMSQYYQTLFFTGDTVSDGTEFNGLKNRITGNQVISNNSGSGGGALSLVKLDTAIRQTYRPTHIFMSSGMLIRLNQAARTTTVGGNIVHTKDELGQQITMYGNLPIVEIVDVYDDDYSALNFSEAASGGGGSATTSIFVANVGSNGLEGIQNGTPEVRQLTEQDNAPARGFRVEWLAGVTVGHPKSVTRLRDITDATPVA